MICKYQVEKYCCGDITEIENYQEAISDTTQTWECHHHYEITYSLSVEELKEKGLYYNVPPEHLIFLTKADHRKLHKENMREESRKKQSDTFLKLWEDPIFREKHHRKQSEEERIRRSEIMKGKNINGKLSKKVLQFSKTGDFMNEYNSTMDIQRQFGFDNSKISCCCLGKRKTAYGFIWKYKE
jgi:hypothetical protein